MPKAPRKKGVLEADTAKAARAQLRQQSLVPAGGARRGTPGTPSDGAASCSGKAGPWVPRVCHLTRQLAGLVASGLPLERP